LPLYSFLRLVLNGSINPVETGSTGREFEEAWVDFVRADVPWQSVDLDQPYHGFRLEHESPANARVTESVDDLVASLKPGERFYTATVRARNEHLARSLFRDLPASDWQAKQIRPLEVLDMEATAPV
jgi:hypothetical protein